VADMVVVRERPSRPAVHILWLTTKYVQALRTNVEEELDIRRQEGAGGWMRGMRGMRWEDYLSESGNRLEAHTERRTLFVSTSCPGRARLPLNRMQPTAVAIAGSMGISISAIWGSP
jgi:hypothetical protein